MYLPKSKYSEPKYTQGDLYTKENGEPYIGWYFQTYDEKYYTGKLPTKKSKPIFNQSHSDLEVTEVKFSNDRVRPTEKDYQQEYFNRYFLEDRRNKNIIEVKKSKYLKFSKKSYINSTTVKWNLSKPVDNLKKGSYIYFGSAAKNKETILEAEKHIKKLSSVIKNYGEFVK